MGAGEQARQVMGEVKKAIIGKDDCVEKVMAAILAGGHVLLEDVPGVGKTEMALAFSKAMGLATKRIQFTPDVMPADITGFSMYRRETGEFVYYPGAVMCNLLLADEINRTAPKTQSALLEVMEEAKVTVDGVTRQTPRPFVVLATQNPLGFAGTQRLPEAQMDRFLICISMGYPELEDEILMLKQRHSAKPTDLVQAVASEEDILRMQRGAEQVFIHDKVYRYIVLLAEATRKHPLLELGISPRGALALGKMARAYAFLEDREYVTPEDVDRTLEDVARHRIRLNAKGKGEHAAKADILEEALGKVDRPRLGSR